MELPETLSCVTLNVLFDPRIPSHSPEHFYQRWPHICDLFKQKNVQVITLQEVHEEFLESVDRFAHSTRFKSTRRLYHTIRNTYLVTLWRCELECISMGSYESLGHYSKMLVVNLVWNDRILSFCNVHLPLGASNPQERLIATRDFLRTAAMGGLFIFVGDWNTLPKRGDVEQLDIADQVGRLVPWKFPDTLECETTFYGFSHESVEYRGYNKPVVLDRLCVATGLHVWDAVCEHHFCEIGGRTVPISDHMPCFYEVCCDNDNK